MLSAVHELRAHGSPDASDRLSARIVAWHDSSASSTGVHHAQGRLFALFAGHQWVRMKTLADSMARTGKGSSLLAQQAVAHVMTGDSAFARTLLVQLSARTDSVARRDALDARASILAALGDKAGAVALLAEAYDGHPRTDLFHFLPGTMYEFLRGYPPFDAMTKPGPE